MNILILILLMSSIWLQQEPYKNSDITDEDFSSPSTIDLVVAPETIFDKPPPSKATKKRYLDCRYSYAIPTRELSRLLK